MASAAAGRAERLRAVDAGDPLTPAARARVREIKRRVDPDRMFAGMPRYAR